MAKELLCTGESCEEYWCVQTDLHVQEASKFNSLTWVGIVTYNGEIEKNLCSRLER